MSTKEAKEAKPKRGRSPYVFFCTEKRPEVVKKYPDLKFGEIGKKLGEMWKDLDDSKKEPYKQKAIKDKERYKNEMSKMGKVMKGKKGKSSSTDSD